METVRASGTSLTFGLVGLVLVSTLSTRNHFRTILTICVLNIINASVASWAFVTAHWSSWTPSSSRTHHSLVRVKNCIKASWSDRTIGCTFSRTVHTALFCTIYLFSIIHILCWTSPTDRTNQTGSLPLSCIVANLARSCGWMTSAVIAGGTKLGHTSAERWVVASANVNSNSVTPRSIVTSKASFTLSTCYFIRSEIKSILTHLVIGTVIPIRTGSRWNSSFRTVLWGWTCF
jgi:hypothetical protein